MIFFFWFREWLHLSLLFIKFKFWTSKKRRNAKKLNCSGDIVYCLILNMDRILGQLGRGISHTSAVSIDSLLVHSLHMVPDQVLNVKKFLKDFTLTSPD